MIILFVISFGAWIIMTFIGFLKSISVHSGIMDYYDNSAYARRARKASLRKHWLITLLMLALACYAGLNLY